MTKKEGILQTPVSRRTFLKGSMAATAAVGAMSMFGCSQPAEQTTAGTTPAETIPPTTAEEPSKPVVEEQVYCGSCRGNCGGGCFLNIHVRDGKVVRTSARDLPDPQYNRICIKGLTLPHRIYHKDRLKYPLRRVGERGAGQWEQITWDEAIKEITDKWKGYHAEFGTDSVGVYFGSGNYAVANGGAVGSARGMFQYVIGASTIAACVDGAHAPGIQPVLGSMGPMTGANEPKDLLNAKTILVWGANPVNSQQQTTHFLLEARDKGAKLITIDPTFTGTAAKSDIYVPVRAGSDAVLAYAMMNVIIEEDLVDWEFVKAHTDAGLLVKDTDKTYLRLSDVRALADGEVDAPVMMKQDGTFDVHTAVADPVLTGTYEVNGISVTTVFDFTKAALAQYTPEYAEEVCAVPVAQIKEVARIYATNTPSTIYTFFGMDHYWNGHYGFRAVAMLAALTGNTGKAGAYCGMQEAMAINITNFMAMFPAEPIMSALTVPITMLDEVLTTGKLGEQDVALKSIYCCHGNIIGNSGDRNEILNAIKKLDFFVVADINLNETAQYADIVLPVAHWFEVEDMNGSFGSTPYMMLQQKAIEVPYECKGDYEIFQLLCAGMGKEGAMPATAADYIKNFLDTDAARELGLTWENMLEKQAIKFLPGDNYIQSEGGNFPTATGRAQFFNEAPAPQMTYIEGFNPDHERSAYWAPPFEAWHENPKHEKYPFNMLQTHLRWRTHTQWWDVEVLDEISGQPNVHMNPADAAAKGITDGDKVKVYNDRGYVVLVAYLDNGVQPGTVTIPHGYEKGQFIEGHYQDLTMNEMHPMAMNTGFFDALVDVVKL